MTLLASERSLLIRNKFRSGKNKGRFTRLYLSWFWKPTCVAFCLFWLVMWVLMMFPVAGLGMESEWSSLQLCEYSWSYKAEACSIKQFYQISQAFFQLVWLILSWYGSIKQIYQLRLSHSAEKVTRSRAACQAKPALLQSSSEACDTPSWRQRTSSVESWLLSPLVGYVSAKIWTTPKGGNCQLLCVLCACV